MHERSLQQYFCAVLANHDSAHSISSIVTGSVSYTTDLSVIRLIRSISIGCLIKNLVFFNGKGMVLYLSNIFDRNRPFNIDEMQFDPSKNADEDKHLRAFTEKATTLT